DQDDGQGEGDDGEDVGDSREEHDRAQEEHRQQEMAGDHVGGETNRQGDRPDDDHREELDQGERELPRHRYPWREHHELQISDESVAPDPDRVVDDPGDEGHHQGEGQSGVQREAHEWDHYQDVSEEDEEEQGGEERQEGQALRPDHLDDHLRPDELDRALHQDLELAGHDGRLPEGQVEDEQHRGDRDDQQDHDVVQPELDPEDLHRPDEVVEHEVPGGWRFAGDAQDGSEQPNRHEAITSPRPAAR